MTEKAAAQPSDSGSGTKEGPTIVGIGASAGGLSALKAFFENVPEDSGLVFVVVVHLASDHESHLADLLQAQIRIPVLQVTETVPLEPNSVYVIPPGFNLSAIDTHVRPTRLEPRRGDRAPIDHFFATLAENHEGNAVGVILTGTGSDGTLGIKDIKTHGGLTIVQDPRQAEYDGMPQSALATGLVDLVLPLETIPASILRYAAAAPRVAAVENGEKSAGDGQGLLQKVFAQVLVRTGRNFNHYKRSTMLRRVGRRMQIRGADSLPAYLAMLRDQPKEARALADDLLITVTHFFRDPEVFEALEKDVIPALLEEKGAGDTVRVWSVGCATGEEPYSLAMLLLEAARARDVAPRIQVFATDLHERSLAKARDGFYSGEIDRIISGERLRQFFVEEDGGYRISADVRELVVFAPHDLLNDPPFSRLDLLVCRNVLIYLDRDVQREVAELMHYALRPGGYLVLGTSEAVDGPDLFETVDKPLCIYRRRSVPGPASRLPVFPITQDYALDGGDWRHETRGGRRGFGGLHQRMVEQYAPPSVLVSADYRVVHLSENAGRYLVHPGGEPTTNLLKVVREDLRVELRATLQAAARDGDPRRSRPVSTSIDGQARSVVVNVRPAPGPEAGFLLVIFDERAAEVGGGDGEDDDSAEPRTHVDDLEGELALAHQRLKAVLDEHESSQEEMRASNEELQSANEELRSTLEELETSKEELQSMNEELQTVNQENRHKVDELAQLSADLQNLLSATEIATLFLDRDLRILRFTPRLGELFSVRNTDRGRPLSDLTHRLGYDRLLSDAAAVLKRLTPVEREIRDDSGSWYLTRMLPYRSVDDRIEGVVITFVDITTRRRSEEALRISEERYRILVEGAIEYALVVIDTDGLIETWSVGAERLFGYDEEEAVGLPMSVLFTEEDREAGVSEDELMGARERGRAASDRLQVRKDGSLFWASGVLTPLVISGELRGYAKVLRDNTEEKRAEEALLQLNRDLEQRVEDRTGEARTQAARVRKMASRLARAEQEERRRLARVLHDDLQQILYAIQMKIGLARNEAAPGDGNAGSRLESAEALLEEAIRTTRRLTVEVSPPLLREEGLVDAISWLVTQVREMHGLDVIVEASDRVRLEDEDLRVLLFQTVRELLFNVAKHAGVKKATVTVGVDAQNVVIRVADEGRGFDVTRMWKDGARMQQFGLSDIRSRLALFHARMEVESGPGTRVTVRAPVESAEVTGAGGGPDSS